jgi:cytochrome P450
MVSYYLLLSIFVPLLLFLKFKSTSLHRKYKLPPGPWTIPIIGSIHHLIGAGSPGLPYRAFRSLSRRYGDIMFLQIGEIPTVVVSSKEAAIEILKTHFLKFSTRTIFNSLKEMFYNGKDIAFAPYGEHWQKVRKISSLELLGAKQVRTFRSIREEEVTNLIQWISSSSNSSSRIVNLSEGLLALTNNVLLRAIMGSKFKIKHSDLNDIIMTMDLAIGFNIANLFPSSFIARQISSSNRTADECHRFIDQLLDKIIREHREEADGEVEDFLRVLLKLHDEDSENNSLDPDIIKAVILVSCLILISLN